MMIKKMMILSIITFIILISISCLGTVEGADITIEDGIAINSINNINDINGTNDINNTNNITIPNITTYEYIINDSDTLQNVSGEIFYSKNKENNVYLINITNDINFTSWSEHLNTFHLDGGFISINGNGHTINLERSRLDSEYHFAQISNNTTFAVVNLTISGFNSPIMNQGIAFFYKCIFINNHVKYYIFSGDEAGVIYNQGYLSCIDCIFMNNSGNYAGAIFSSNGAINNLTNCTFENNVNYKNDGATLYDFNKAKYIINNVNATKDNNKLNVSIVYGSPPGTLTKAFMHITTYIVSFLIGVCGGVVGCPLAFVVLGTIVGTTLDLGFIGIHKNLCHEEFKEFTYGEIGLSIFSHLIVSIMGAVAGTYIQEDMINENMQMLREFNQRIGNVENIIQL